MFVHGYTDDEYEPDDQPTLISRLDVINPLYLYPNDSVALTIVFVKLKGIENYQVWSCAMLLALKGKNKTGFIDGTCKRLNALCKQFDALVQLPGYTCHAANDFKKHNQLIKLMQFLTRLDYFYMQIRSNIVSRDILPDVRNACDIISSKESHRVVSSSGSGTSRGLSLLRLILIWGIGTMLRDPISIHNFIKMSNTNNTMQTQTSNTLHSDIMEAGGKDRPPMLAPDKEVTVTEGSSVTTTERYMENYKNVSQDTRDQLDAEAEAVQIILTGIDNDIYSTFDACPNACEMRKAIERLKQELKTVSYQKLYDILKQHQNEVNEIRAERLARTANPLALVAQQQPVYHPQNHPNHYTQNSSTRSQQAATRNRGKAIVNSPPPIYNQEPSMVAEDDEIGNGYDNQMIGNVAGARETVGTTMVQKSRIQYYNCKEFEHVARECQKPNRVKDATYHKEMMLLYKQEEVGFQLNAEQADWRDDIDDESEDQELEAHYIYMAQIQEVSLNDVDNSGPIFDSEPLQKVTNDDNYNVFAIESEHPEQSKSVNDTYPIEQDEHNVIIDSLDMSYDREQIDQNDDDLANKRELLASLIEKLKCEIDDSKNRNKFFETSNKVLVDKLKELDRHNDVKYASKMEIDCAKAKGDLMSYKIESAKSFNQYTQKINDLNQTISEMKKELFVHQETISILSQAKEAHIKLYKTREDKELDKVTALENKVKVLDNIVYKTSQSVQIMNMLNRNCKTSFAKPEFLKKSQRANPRLYDIGCYNDNLALMLAPESDEVIRLKKESRSKLSDLIRPLDYEKLNNLYDLFVPQHEKSSKQRYFSEMSKMSHTPVNNGNSKESFNKQTTLLEKRMDESITYDQKCKSSKELFKIKRSVGTIIDGVERCKQTIVKRTYFGHIDPLIQNTIEAIFCPEIRRINADLEKFHLCLKEEMIADLRYFNSLELEVDSLKSQLETQKTQPKLKGNQTEDIVMLNNSQGKKQEVEDHRRNVRFSKNKTPVTACNDSLNAKTSNVNFVCATCGKCVLNEKHDMCVLKSLNGMNSRTKMPMDVPVSTREPKHTVNQSVAKPLRKTVASESTNQKPRHTNRKLYENVNKECSRWYPKYTPPGYKWKPKSQIGNVNPNVSMPLGNASRTANILEHMTPRRSTVSKTTLYSNSFVARRDYPIHRRLWVLKAHDGKSQAFN
nr:ribonuclease H-like domain-containing protein [Tanacetum cinerariifolium]